MKQKIFMLLAAVLLSSASMFAQSNEPLKGDVNEDGVVDVADVVAVIDIIAKSQNNSETTYYWYVGQTDPSTMSSITPIVNDLTSPGWREIGTTLPAYSASNKLYDPTQNEIVWTTKSIPYIAVPKNATINFYDSLGNNITSTYIKQNDITLNDVVYEVYAGQVGVKRFSALLY